MLKKPSIVLIFETLSSPLLSSPLLSHPMTALIKKRPSSSSSSSIRRHLGLGLQLIASLSLLICFISLLNFQSQSQSLSLSDEQPSGSIRRRTPKIAFLFLARSSLPLDFIWHTFFQNAHVGSFSIYIHSQPGFVFDTITTRSPFFYGRQLNNSLQVAWGESTIIQAERMLLSAALEDPVNHRFILLSDSCVPLYNFSYVYNYLMSSSRSFVDSFLDKNEARYNPKMSPIIPKEKWRKGSQWIALVRKHAEVVVVDDAIFQVFKKFCKKSVGQKEHNCISDEHYMQTLLSMRELGNELEQRTLTYTSWNHSTSEVKKQSWHPMTFEYANASPQHISEIKNINHIYYETEHRTEWCQSNATSVPCFLFVRKFSRGAAMRLLSEEFGGLFDPPALHQAHPD